MAENPEYAARCLVGVEKTITGPAEGLWRPTTGRDLQDALVSVILAREGDDGTVDPATATLLEPDALGLVAYDVPEGRWRLFSVWSGFSGGTIRGVFPWEEDGHATAPAAGDLMSPEAVGAFLRLTHDAYYREMGDHFGSTIVGMFTDEPSPSGAGRAAARSPGPIPPGSSSTYSPVGRATSVCGSPSSGWTVARAGRSSVPSTGAPCTTASATCSIRASATGALRTASPSPATPARATRWVPCGTFTGPGKTWSGAT